MKRMDVYKDWEMRNPTACMMMKAQQCSEFEEADRLELLSLLPSWSGKQVVDLAAGIGRFTGPFAKEARHVTAVEWIPTFVETNQLQHIVHDNITYICDDVMNVDFPESSVDLIFMSWLFMYLEDEEVQTLAQRIHRWLVPGGSFFVRETVAPKRVAPTTINPTHYRTLKEYDDLLSTFVLKKEGSVQAQIDYLAKPYSCYWLVEKSSNFSRNPAISGIPVCDPTKTPPLSK